MIQNATYRLRKNNNLLLKSMTLVAKINSKISTDKVTGGGQMLHPRNWVPQVERKNFLKKITYLDCLTASIATGCARFAL